MTIKANSMTSSILHFPRYSITRNVSDLCRRCSMSSKLNSNSSTILVSGKTIENRNTTPPTNQLPCWNSAKVPPMMLDSDFTPSCSTCRMGSNTAGQNNTKAPNAAAAVRLAERAKLTGGLKAVPQRVQVALWFGSMAGMRWIRPQQ